MLTVYQSRKRHQFQVFRAPLSYGQRYKRPREPQASERLVELPGGTVIWSMRGNLQGKQLDSVCRFELTCISVTHLHNDTIPKIGGDTLWASGMFSSTRVWT
jgi:hypothetical protein